MSWFVYDYPYLVQQNKVLWCAAMGSLYEFSISKSITVLQLLLFLYTASPGSSKLLLVFGMLWPGLHSLSSYLVLLYPPPFFF